LEITVHVEPGTSELPAVEYRWDADTDILTATMNAGAKDLIFDVDDASHIAGVWLLNVPPFPTDQ